MLSTDEAFRGSGWDPDVYRRVVMTLGFIILGADSALFYASTCMLGWGRPSFSFSALLATAAYLAVIVFVSLVSLKLSRPFRGR
jgi:hypothetical protein